MASCPFVREADIVVVFCVVRLSCARVNCACYRLHSSQSNFFYPFIYTNVFNIHKGVAQTAPSSRHIKGNTLHKGVSRITLEYT